MVTIAPHSVRVMLAEDSEIIRDRLVEMLKDASGIDLVGVACDAPEASALFFAVRPAAAILDIQMPSGSGIRVLEEIKRTDRSCVVVILTSFAFPELRQRCLDSGADFFLDKATEFERILDVLDDMGTRGAVGPRLETQP